MPLSQPPPESDDARDRRRAPRELSCIPVDLGTDESSRQVAMICNISTSGAALMTRAKFAIDDDVALTLYLETDRDKSELIAGRVKRIEKRTEGEDIWPYEAGIVFDRSIEHLAPEIEAICARLRRAGIIRE